MRDKIQGKPATREIHFPKWLFPSLWANRKTVPVTYIDRQSLDYMDLCDAKVKTNWFMLVNAYHHVSPEVSLLFTHDDAHRPVIPYTPADTSYCTDYDACREVIRLAREILPNLNRVVLDTEMLYHTPSRDAFCKEWKSMNGDFGEILSAKDETGIDSYLEKSTPRGPTATAYLAHLSKTGVVDNLYEFTNKLHYGSKDTFVKIYSDKENEVHEPMRKQRELFHLSDIWNIFKFGQHKKERNVTSDEDLGYGKTRKRYLELSKPGLLVAN